MDEIRVGSVVVIQDEAVYGGLSADYRGMKVPKSQCSPTTHTVINIKPHYGEQEMHLKEIDSWVSARYLRLYYSYSETNTGTAVVNQNSFMSSGTGKLDVDNIFVIFIVIVIVLNIRSVIHDVMAKSKVLHLYGNANPTIINRPGGTLNIYDHRDK